MNNAGVGENPGPWEKRLPETAADINWGVVWRQAALRMLAWQAGPIVNTGPRHNHAARRLHNVSCRGEDLHRRLAHALRNSLALMSPRIC